MTRTSRKVLPGWHAMRTTPLLLAATALALLAPTAGALGLRIGAEAGAARVDVEVPGLAVEARLASAADATGLLGEPLLDATLGQAAALAPALPAAPKQPAPAPAAGLPPVLGPAAGAASGDASPSSAAAPAATTVGGLALVWLLVEKLGAARALVALYFRVQPGELLENERRERVLKLVRERPGIGPTEIAQDLGTAWGVTSYHLDRLERAGFVTSQRSGHHRCYFLPGALPRDQRQTLALFRGETTRRVAQLVAQRPGIRQSQLCEELGLSPSAASKQLARLVATGLVRRDVAAGSSRLFPTGSLAAAF